MRAILNLLLPIILLLSGHISFSQITSLKSPEFTYGETFYLRNDASLRYIGATDKFTIFKQTNDVNHADNLVYFDKATLTIVNIVKVNFSNKDRTNYTEYVILNNRIIAIGNEYNKKNNMLTVLATAFNEEGIEISPTTLLMTLENRDETSIDLTAKKINEESFGVSCKVSINKTGDEAQLIYGKVTADFSKKEFVEIKNNRPDLGKGVVSNVEFGLSNDDFLMGFFTESVISENIMPKTFMVHFNNKSELTYKQELFVKDARIKEANYSILPNSILVKAHYSYDRDNEIMGSTIYKFNFKNKNYSCVETKDFDIKFKRSFVIGKDSLNRKAGIDRLYFLTTSAHANGLRISVKEQIIKTVDTYRYNSPGHSKTKYSIDYQSKNLLVELYDSNGTILSTPIVRTVQRTFDLYKTFKLSNTSNGFVVSFRSHPSFMRDSDHKIDNFIDNDDNHIYLTTFTKDHNHKIEQLNDSNISTMKLADYFNTENNEVILEQYELISIMRNLLSSKLKTRLTKFNFSSRIN